MLEPGEMVEFGRQCKRLIDAGRLDYVRRELPHLAAGTSSQTYGSILAAILHSNGVPCCWNQGRAW